MKILIISDVHRDIKILNKILNDNKNVDYKLFLGDLELQSYKKQKEIIKLFDFSVQGNCDIPNISPLTQFIELGGVKLMMTHGHYYGGIFQKINFDKLVRDGKSNNVDIILHGHDHIEHDEIINGLRVFNPGSTTQPRKNLNGSYGIMEIRNKKIYSLKIIYLAF